MRSNIRLPQTFGITSEEGYIITNFSQIFPEETRDNLIQMAVQLKNVIEGDLEDLNIYLGDIISYIRGLACLCCML